MSTGEIVSTAREDLARSVGAGFAAYAVGLAALYVLATTLTAGIVFLFELLAGGSLFGGAVPTWKVVGWAFYNAHLVDVRLGGVAVLNVLTAVGGIALVLVVVPALVLVGTGWLLADRRGLEAPLAGVGVGVALVPGYLLLVLIGGIVVFPHDVGGITSGPVGLTAMALSGVAWPLVFGSAGAALYVLDDGGTVLRVLTSGAVQGAVLGAVAFVVGYHLLLAVVAANFSQIMPDFSGIVQFLLDVLNVELPPPRNVAGWAFYNAHGVDVRIPTGIDANPFDGDGVGIERGNKNFLAEQAAGKVLFAYPPLLLGVAGALAARNARSLAAAAAAGAATVVGYAPLFLSRASDFDYTVSIDLRVDTIDVTIHLVQDGWFTQAAVVYPLVFGTAGALVLYHFGPRLPLVGR